MNELRKQELAQAVENGVEALQEHDFESARVFVNTAEELELSNAPVYKILGVSADEFLDGYASEYKMACINELSEEEIAGAAELLRQAYQDTFGDLYDTLMNVLLNHIEPDLLDALQAV